MFLEDSDFDPGAGEEKAEHHAGRASADDAAGGLCNAVVVASECDEGSKRRSVRSKAEKAAIVLDSSHPICFSGDGYAVASLDVCCGCWCDELRCRWLRARAMRSAGKAWWAHVQYLADDSMHGRLTGSEEYLKAAAYVVDKFKSYGLEPAGVNGGLYQPVKFDVQRVIAEKSSMSLVADGKATAGARRRMRYSDARSAQAGKVDAPLVFIGYGLHLPESKYDDFDSTEVPQASLKGKVVVVINGGPADLPGPLKSYARTAPFIEGDARCGGGGAISIPTPKSMDFGWQRVASGASQPGMRLAATSGCTRPWRRSIRRWRTITARCFRRPSIRRRRRSCLRNGPHLCGDCWRWRMRRSRCRGLR